MQSLRRLVPVRAAARTKLDSKLPYLTLPGTLTSQVVYGKLTYLVQAYSGKLLYCTVP